MAFGEKFKAVESMHPGTDNWYTLTWPELVPFIPSLNGAPIATVLPLLLNDTDQPLLSAEDSPDMLLLNWFQEVPL